MVRGHSAAPESEPRFEPTAPPTTHFTPSRDSMEPSHNWYCTSLENWRPRGCVGSSPTGSAQPPDVFTSGGFFLTQAGHDRFARRLPPPPLGAPMSKSTIFVAVHGIGDQIRNETVQAVAKRVYAHEGKVSALPLGAFVLCGSSMGVERGYQPAASSVRADRRGRGS